MPLRMIPKGMVLPILQGRLKGAKWISGAGEHGYWLGSYELQKRMAFEREIVPDSVIFDIGANVGYFSLLAAVLAGSEGKVYAFEPLPRNVRYLRQHVALNHLENRIEVVEAAVSDREGEAHFDLGPSTAMGHLADSGEITVQMVVLDDLLEKGELRPPDYMKVDVEGAEFEVLSGAHHIIENHRPVLFMDTHNRQAHESTVKFLAEADYQFTILDGKPLAESKEFIAKPRELS